jgi:hypothetical protein
MHQSSRLVIVVRLCWEVFIRVGLTLFLLLLTDLLILFGGFPSLYKFVRRWPCRTNGRLGLQIQAEPYLATVERVRLFYFKQIKCLQLAAVMVCLLRFYGIFANLVIGVRPYPFYAHAWVELGDSVIHGIKDRSSYIVVDRV